MVCWLWASALRLMAEDLLGPSPVDVLYLIALAAVATNYNCSRSRRAFVAAWGL